MSTIFAVLGGGFLEPDPLNYLFGSGIGTNIGASIFWALIAGGAGYWLKGHLGRIRAHLDALHARHDQHEANHDALMEHVARVGQSVAELHARLDGPGDP